VSVIVDIHFGLKQLWKHSGYAATAILTLALCIGANAAIFTIVNSVLLKPLPVPDSGRILVMSNQYPNAGTGITAFTNSGVPDYYDRLRDMTVYEEQAMYNGTNQAFEINGAPELIRGMAATPALFRLLHVPPAYGRIFDDSEGEIGNEQKVILSYPLWQQLYGSNAGVVGQQVRLSGRPFTIVGVMPKGFEFADSEARFWIPLAFTAQQKSDDFRHSNSWYNIGRLKPGATIEQAQEQVNAINAANFERFPQFKQLLVNAGFHTRVERLQDVLVRGVRPTLYLLWGGAAFVLLIGAVNLANVALARSNLRAKELTTRLAIGAGRTQVARQLIIESLLLSLAAGAAGLAVGYGILRALDVIGLERIPRAHEINMDFTVVAAALAVATVAGLLIGLVPAVHLFKVNLSTALREESRTGTGGRKTQALRRVLVVTQVAFAFVLLIGSGLLLGSFRNLLAADPGFKTEGIITAAIGMPRVRYPADKDVVQFTDRVLRTVRAVPGVAVAGGTTIIPLGGNHNDSVILAEGYQMKPGESLVSPMQVTVTPGYFETMGTPLIKGRYFDDRDNETSPGVVIVDQRLAQKFWPGADPIGRRMYKPSNPRDLLKIDENTRWLTVVGVVREVQFEDLAGRPTTVGAYYFAAAQPPPPPQGAPRGLALAIKTSGDPAAVLSRVRAELNKLDPAMPLADVRTMQERVALSLMSRRAAMLLAISFGVISLFLSAVGIYGVLAYLVTQRSREISIRIALGSTPRGVFRLVLREGLWLVGIGFVLGLAGTAALRRVLEGQLYGLGAMDPRVIAIVMVLLGIIALAACSLPARRATRLDPVSVLTEP
jgi:putative ABC transport system permease protein